MSRIIFPAIYFIFVHSYLSVKHTSMKPVTLRFQTDPKSVQKDARKPQCSRTRQRRTIFRVPNLEMIKTAVEKVNNKDLEKLIILLIILLTISLIFFQLILEMEISLHKQSIQLLKIQKLLEQMRLLRVNKSNLTAHFGVRILVAELQVLLRPLLQGGNLISQHRCFFKFWHQLSL